MFEWISEHSSALNVLLSLATVLVWVTYLHLLLMAYRRQRQFSIIINRGAGSGLNAHCLISNMSAEPIYIQQLVAVLKNKEGEWTAAVTDLDELAAETTEIRALTNQGPLKPGEFFDAGTYADLGGRAAKRAGAPGAQLKDFDTLEITVIAAYGPETLLVAARRAFAVKDGELLPETVSTEQIRSRARRQELGRFLRDNP